MFRKVALNTDLEMRYHPWFIFVSRERRYSRNRIASFREVSVDGVFYDGISESGFIEKGGKVKVVRFENAQVYVENL